MRSLNITDELFSETKDRIYNIMLLQRNFNLSVTSSAHLFEDHIIFQMKNIVGGFADKSEDHIERGHQGDKRSKRIYYGLTNFQQYQISQVKNNDMMTNLKVK